ncbi:MAG: hypothetical protein IBX64_08845, partial [Actinobacteria bacterium]|nr:hypothetical protein [Actinomycetota bacterium]
LGCAGPARVNIETSVDSFTFSKEFKEIAKASRVEEKESTIEYLGITTRGGEIESFQLSFSAPKNHQYAGYSAVMGRDQVLFIEKAREGSRAANTVGDLTMAEFASTMGSLSLADLSVGLEGGGIYFQLEYVLAGEPLVSIDRQRVFTLSNGKLAKVKENESVTATTPSRKLVITSNSATNIILLSDSYSSGQL